MKLGIGIMTFVSALMLAGCQSAQVFAIDPSPHFQDELFPDYQLYPVETQEDVFAIGEKAMQFVDEKLKNINKPDHRIKALSKAIFARSDLNLLYINDANTVANETFINAAANCLSLVIMTSSMAEYAGIDVKFQQVDTPDMWVRREGNSILNRHVNLRLLKKSATNIILMHSKSYLLDFDQRARAMRLPSQHISKERVLAMFYNNKGADHLIKKEYQQAYAYFRASLETDSQLIESWTNLGTLYSRLGKNQYAEATYNKALTIKHSDPTILENLSHIYSLTGRHDAAKKIQAKIKSQRRDNPYYHYMLGEVEFEMKNWHIAIDHFKDSIRLDHKQHQFYFSMAKSYFHLGDMDKSEKYLQLAKRYTPSDRLEAKYQGKLNLLHTL